MSDKLHVKMAADDLSAAIPRNTIRGASFHSVREISPRFQLKNKNLERKFRTLPKISICGKQTGQSFECWKMTLSFNVWGVVAAVVNLLLDVAQFWREVRIVHFIFGNQTGLRLSVEVVFMVEVTVSKSSALTYAR